MDPNLNTETNLNAEPNLDQNPVTNPEIEVQPSAQKAAPISSDLNSIQAAANSATPMQAHYEEPLAATSTSAQPRGGAADIRAKGAEPNLPSAAQYPLMCQNITKLYRGSRAPALTGINLGISRGRIVGLLGPNGSGKTTLIKLACGLLTPDSGEIFISGFKPGIESKKRVSYLPDKSFLPNWMRVTDLLDYFADFYTDFDRQKAIEMLARLRIDPAMRLKTMSKGTHEKVQLIMAMSRTVDLYLLDEPIGGVDPAARDYILETIITNYSESSTVVISTHLIADIENVLDDVIFINEGTIALASSVDIIREQQGKSVDALFREVFRC